MFGLPRLDQIPILANVARAFDPPEGQKPFTYVIDMTGEILYDRPDAVSSYFLFSLSDHSCREYRIDATIGSN